MDLTIENYTVLFSFDPENDIYTATVIETVTNNLQHVVQHLVDDDALELYEEVVGHEPWE